LTNGEVADPYKGVSRKDIVAALEETQAAYTEYERRWRALKAWIAQRQPSSFAFRYGDVERKMAELDGQANGDVEQTS